MGYNDSSNMCPYTVALHTIRAYFIYLQMGKQTMGTPCHALAHRSDNKMYRIQSPQTTLVRPAIYDDYAVDNYPLGTNAVVAVISYTVRRHDTIPIIV